MIRRARSSAARSRPKRSNRYLTNSRSPLDLIFTLGGVTEEPLSTRDLAEDRQHQPHANTPEEAGTFALSGGPAYSNNITIDGLDNNDDRAARERFQPSLEAVEEVQVITNQFSAEYGRASGGRINMRTRGGSNRYRGRAFYFFRNDIFNANTLRNNSLGIVRLPLEEHNPGFTFSGPVVLPQNCSAHSLIRARSHLLLLSIRVRHAARHGDDRYSSCPSCRTRCFELPAPTNPDAAQQEI